MHTTTTRALGLAICSLSLISCVKASPVKEPTGAHGKSAKSNLAVQHPAPSSEAPASVSPQTTPPPAPAHSTPSETADDAPQKPVSPESPVLADCDTSIRFTDGEPVYLPETKVVITRVMSPCRDKNGVPGHKKNAGWMAMGFPCTGGEGRIDWKGTNYNRPKMVSFLLETSCAMAPKDHSLIKKEAEKVAGIPPTSAMIAFNPFVIQYWEVPGFDDADTSFTVDLRSSKGIDDAWIKFIKPKPLRVFIVGRENAWVPGNYMYAVEADLNWASKNRFTMRVETARKLSGDELSKVRGRCEALRPERECGRVF